MNDMFGIPDFERRYFPVPCLGAFVLESSPRTLFIFVSWCVDTHGQARGTSSKIELFLTGILALLPLHVGDDLLLLHPYCRYEVPR